MHEETGMNHLWLHRRRTSLCLVFFAGWGMDAHPFAPLASGGVDVCLLSGYRDVVAPTLPELRDYDEVVVLAWSFGVWMAARVCGRPFQAACADMIALAGTLKPVDDRLGLAPERFDAILADFDESALAAFYQAMFDDPAHHALFLQHRPRRGLDSLEAELAFLRRVSLKAPAPPDIFSRRVVTGRDRIFSGRNQSRAWGREKARVLPWPHFPFYRFSTWAELLAALRRLSPRR